MTDEFKIFLEYYKRTRSVNLNEAPSNTGFNYPNHLDDPTYNKEVAKDIILNNSVYARIQIGNQTYNVYRTSNTDTGSYTDIWINRNSEVICRFTYKSVEGYIIMRGVWQYEQAIGVAREIFFIYYLPTVEFIQSDFTHSIQGREYWKKLLQTAQQKHLPTTVYDINSKSEVDLDWNYFNQNATDGNIAYRIYNKS